MLKVVMLNPIAAALLAYITCLCNLESNGTVTLVVTELVNDLAGD